MMAVLGVMEFRARNVGKLLSLLLPIALTLLASSMHRYPFQGRLLLFLVPSLLLMITAGLGTVQKTTWEALPLMNVLLVGFLFLNPLWDSGNQFVKPTGRQEIRPAIDYIEKHLSQGDVLYCYYGAEPALQYYRQRGLIRPVNQVTGVASPENWELYRLDLDKLRGRRRVWILFSHVSHSYGVDEQLLFLDYLNQIGKRLGGMQVTGASAFLYDLSNDGTQSDISGISSDSIRPELAK